MTLPPGQRFASKGAIRAIADPAGARSRPSAMGSLPETEPLMGRVEAGVRLGVCAGTPGTAGTGAEPARRMSFVFHALGDERSCCPGNWSSHLTSIHRENRIGPLGVGQFQLDT